MKTDKPIVLACAGCSFAGRLAYELAQELDRRGAAEMSCLAGVAADLPCFRKKLEDREVWIIDGLPARVQPRDLREERPHRRPALPAAR